MRTHDQVCEFGGTAWRSVPLVDVFEDHRFVWPEVVARCGPPDASFLIVKAGIVVSMSGDAAGILEIEMGRCA